MCRRLVSQKGGQRREATAAMCTHDTRHDTIYRAVALELLLCVCESWTAPQRQRGCGGNTPHTRSVEIPHTTTKFEVGLSESPTELFKKTRLSDSAPACVCSPPPPAPTWPGGVRYERLNE